MHYSVRIDAKANLEYFKQVRHNPKFPKSSFTLTCRKEGDHFVTARVGLIPYWFKEEIVPDKYVLSSEYIGPQR